jgi:aspartate ammonia-lyase
MTERGFRVEADLLGQRNVPDSAYYGVHSAARAELRHLRAHDRVAAVPRRRAGGGQARPPTRTASSGCCRAYRDAIAAACAEIRDGRLHDQFVVDVIQGAGTSTNMNANEVITNRALEIMGHARGQYEHLHPIEHVNRARAPTTSTRPRSASRPASRSSNCSRRWRTCATRSRRRPTQFADLLKLGRTQLQDAVPMTLGQEFSTYAVRSEDIARLQEAGWLMREINLGATAIGTGITAHPTMRRRRWPHCGASPAST